VVDSLVEKKLSSNWHLSACKQRVGQRAQHHVPEVQGMNIIAKYSAPVLVVPMGMAYMTMERETGRMMNQ
jgi:hypothetical protein